MTRLAIADDCTTAADVMARAHHVKALRRAEPRQPYEAPPVCKAPPRPASPTMAPKVTPLVAADFLALRYPQMTAERCFASPMRVLAAVSEYYGVTVQSLLAANQCREFSQKRQMAMYLAKKLAPRSWTSIGRVMNRDPATLRHGVAAMTALVGEGRGFAADAAAIEAMIVGPTSQCQVVTK